MVEQFPGKGDVGLKSPPETHFSVEFNVNRSGWCIENPGSRLNNDMMGIGTVHSIFVQCTFVHIDKL